MMKAIVTYGIKKTYYEMEYTEIKERIYTEEPKDAIYNGKDKILHKVYNDFRRNNIGTVINIKFIEAE